MTFSETFFLGALRVKDTSLSDTTKFHNFIICFFVSCQYISTKIKIFLRQYVTVDVQAPYNVSVADPE